MKKVNLSKLLVFTIINAIGIYSIAQTNNRVFTTEKSPVFYADDIEIKNSISRIAELIKHSKVTLYKLQVADELYHKYGSGKDIMIMDDKIQIKREGETINYHFRDIITSSRLVKDSTGLGVNLFIGDFDIFVWGEANGQRLLDEINFIRHQNEKLISQERRSQFESQLILFEKIAADYRVLEVKPAVSEEQRKYIVQANAFNEKKMYETAIELYLRSIELNPASYPTAYSNLALISAYIKQYHEAIFYMRKYLLLVPTATDARDAQDKIYIWEAEIENQNF